MHAPNAEPGARFLALDVLCRVEAGAWASILLEHRAARLGDRRDSALLQELVLGTLRQRRVLDAALAQAAGREIETLDVPVRNVLRLGAYQLLFLDRVPRFAAVSTSVALARAGAARRASGLVNAVLRRVAREGAALLPPPPAAGDVAGLALLHSHPDWWTRRVVARHGWARAVELLEADNRPAPAVVRADRRRGDAADLARRLADEGFDVEPCRFAPAALRVRGGDLHASRALAEGRGFVQDEASQLVVPLLDDPLGPRVADLCAAPGSKTLQLVERLAPGAALLAVELRRGRARRLAARLARAGARDVAILAADAAAPRAPFRSGAFDRILLDAPCSGSGTLRRHPELRWRLAADDLPRLAARQARLLDAAAQALAPGGQIAYSVCSIEPEEGEQGVASFLERNTDFEVLDTGARVPADIRAADDFLRTIPGAGGLDGFFAALLVRRSGSG